MKNFSLVTWGMLSEYEDLRTLATKQNYELAKKGYKTRVHYIGAFEDEYSGRNDVFFITDIISDGEAWETWENLLELFPILEEEIKFHISIGDSDATVDAVGFYEVKPEELENTYKRFENFVDIQWFEYLDDEAEEFNAVKIIYYDLGLERLLYPGQREWCEKYAKEHGLILKKKTLKETFSHRFGNEPNYVPDPALLDLEEFAHLDEEDGGDVDDLPDMDITGIPMYDEEKEN